MSALFEELDYCPTPIGGLSLRRRRDLKLDVDVFEIKLGEESLMSSLFTESEIALARLGLADLRGENLDVVVGGLGLGYTAKAALENANVRSLIVVEARTRSSVTPSVPLLLAVENPVNNAGLIARRKRYGLRRVVK